MCQQGSNSSSLKSHNNIVSQKENDKSPETKHKVKEYYDLTDREFNTAVIKKLKELQENSQRQFNELRTKIKEQKKYFSKDTEL